MSRQPAHPGRALTLLEVIIAISLIGLIMSTLLTFFWQSLEIREKAGKSAARTQVVQQLLRRMADELREAVGLESTGFEGLPQFVGERRRITFLTAAPLPAAESYVFVRPTDVLPAARHDLVGITYELWIDPDKDTESGDPLVGGILRTEKQALNPSLREGQVSEEDQERLYQRRDLWSYEFGYLEFRYFDGKDWSTTWNVTQGNALPHLVQITVGFDSLTRAELDDQDLQQFPIEQREYRLGPNVPNANRYSIIVRLPAADELFAARLNRVADQTEEVYEFGGPTQTGGTTTGGTTSGGKSGGTSTGGGKSNGSTSGGKTTGAGGK